jgi:hypothetical protein
MFCVTTETFIDFLEEAFDGCVKIFTISAVTNVALQIAVVAV